MNGKGWVLTHQDCQDVNLIDIFQLQATLIVSQACCRKDLRFLKNLGYTGTSKEPPHGHKFQSMAIQHPHSGPMAKPWKVRKTTRKKSRTKQVQILDVFISWSKKWLLLGSCSHPTGFLTPRVEPPLSETSPRNIDTTHSPVRRKEMRSKSTDWHWPMLGPWSKKWLEPEFAEFAFTLQ